MLKEHPAPIKKESQLGWQFDGRGGPLARKLIVLIQAGVGFSTQGLSASEARFASQYLLANGQQRATTDTNRAHGQP